MHCQPFWHILQNPCIYIQPHNLANVQEKWPQSYKILQESWPPILLQASCMHMEDACKSKYSLIILQMCKRNGHNLVRFCKNIDCLRGFLQDVSEFAASFLQEIRLMYGNNNNYPHSIATGLTCTTAHILQPHYKLTETVCLLDQCGLC